MEKLIVINRFYDFSEWDKMVKNKVLLVELKEDIERIREIMYTLKTTADYMVRWRIDRIPSVFLWFLINIFEEARQCMHGYYRTRASQIIKELHERTYKKNTIPKKLWLSIKNYADEVLKIIDETKH